MNSNVFAANLAALRTRFIEQFDAKLHSIDLAVATLKDVRDEGQTVAHTYRSVHNLTGICSTMGMERTGRAASVAEAILHAAVQGERSLTVQETVALQQKIAVIRTAARWDRLSSTNGEINS